MSQETVVDLAILGGGCAGLSLAYSLVNRHVERSVVVIEPRVTYTNDRSWCFWAVDGSVSDAVAPMAGSIWQQVHHRWSRWAFGQADQPVIARHASGISYQYLRSSDFYHVCCDGIESSTAVDLCLGQAVQAVTPVSAGWQITTDTQVFVARQVIDTRPPDPGRSGQASLQQVFLGVEIELAAPTGIDVSTAEIMTDMRLVDGEFCFTYVLPYTATRLLVEVTFFARMIPDQSVLETELNRVLDKRGWQQASVVRREYAVLPMGLPMAPHTPGQPARAGMAGGALRASSGYGFLRIQRWAELCAQHYLAHGEVVGHPKPGLWWRAMDQLFLDVLAANPALAPEIFDRLLSRIEPARFVRFMSDQATWTDCLLIIACLPKWPFLVALAKRLLALGCSTR
jgi:lycopene beta-cyclase